MHAGRIATVEMEGMGGRPGVWPEQPAAEGGAVVSVLVGAVGEGEGRPRGDRRRRPHEEPRRRLMRAPRPLRGIGPVARRAEQRRVLVVAKYWKGSYYLAKIQ